MEKVNKLIEKNGKGSGCLIGQDGNAFSLMGYTSRRLRLAGWKNNEIDLVMEEAMSGDYNNLIRVLASTLEG